MTWTITARALREPIIDSIAEQRSWSARAGKAAHPIPSRFIFL